MLKHVSPVLTLIMLFTFCTLTKAQKVDSIFFHLYTDSLKKGTYNYINVDGKLQNGSWFPLSEKQLSFSATGGKFDGNSLILDTGFLEEKVTVRAVLRSDTSIAKSVTIYLKKQAETERVKTKAEILREIEQSKPRKKGS